MKSIQTMILSGMLLMTFTAFPQSTNMRLRFLGQETFNNQSLTFEGTVPGGLSGIDYDATTDSYIAISDDQSVPERGDARFYRITLDFDLQGFHGYQFEAVETLKDQSGNVFPTAGVDPEAIRLLPNGNLLWSSEGFENSNPQIDPFIWEMRPDGSFVRAFQIPQKFNPTPDAGTGSRLNLVFESLTVSPDGSTVFTGTEGALRSDGEEATAINGSPSRLIAFDFETGEVTGEYVYENEKVVNGTTLFSVNGLVELLAMSSTKLLALERSFSIGFGNKVRLYEIDLSAATNVMTVDSLIGASYTPVRKTLVADLSVMELPLDNLEGITFGPTLANGNPSLVIVSDDNFGFGGFTQFMAFEVITGPRIDFWGPGLAVSEHQFYLNWAKAWVYEDPAKGLFFFPRLGWVSPLGGDGAQGGMVFFSLSDGLISTSPEEWPNVFNFSKNAYELAGASSNPIPIISIPDQNSGPKLPKAWQFMLKSLKTKPCL